MRGVFLCSRWGAIEGNALFCKTVGEDVASFSAHLQNNAGVYPFDNPKVINEYLDISAWAAGMIDYFLVAIWCSVVEDLYEWYSPKAIPMSVVFYPYKENGIWIKALSNKRVLVVHPFAKLIETQYRRKDKLFKEEFLPSFELITVQAVQSLGGNDDFDTWIDAFEYMKRQISEIEFDIALLGCGAYGMPLGAFIKEQLKKPAIHIGGSLQLLFGLKGRRWDDILGNELYNEYWVRPTDDLKPQNYMQVENGCYW